MRAPYSVAGLAEAGQKVTPQQKAELSVMVPAFTAMIRGRQAQESLAGEVDADSKQTFWSPYNEVTGLMLPHWAIPSLCVAFLLGWSA